MDNNQKHIPFAVIVAATNGDEAAIQEMDSELKGRIQAAVMDMIANFEIIVI